MKSWYSEETPESETDMVDAIEEGKIVKVPLSYAKKEDLPILRKPLIKTFQEPKKNKQFEHEERLSIDDLRKPLRPEKSQVVASLVENFQWEIAKKRRAIGLSRKQLAVAISETESTIKLIENGIFPKDDFIIINKIQEYLKINLRKDQQDFSQPARKLLKEDTAIKSLHDSKEESLSGTDIQIIDDDDED